MYQAVADLQGKLDSLLKERAAQRVLEAGCGSASYLRVNDGAKFFGIDISQEQLTRHETLDEKILGDIQTYPLPESYFDLIVCWDVLEHLPNPDLAMNNFVRAVKDDGLIILAFPNRDSMKGLLTRLTPFWFHVWAYRYMLGIKTAGQEGKGPFETFLKPSIAPDAIKDFAKENDLVIEFFRLVESPMQKQFVTNHRALGAVWNGLSALVQKISRDHISRDLTDCVLMLRKAGRSGESA